MEQEQVNAAASGAAAQFESRQARAALAVVVAAQLLVVLDASIVNIALPAAQADLDMADSIKQWVVTGYSLAFGSFLLLGGRVADVFGRKKTFLAGLAGFTVASVLGGMAADQSMLLAARAAQGIAAAFLAPAGLAILTTVFPQGRARAKAFAIFGAATGSGGVVGMVLGGVLTAGSWRWCLLINLPLGLVVLILALRWLEESTSTRSASFDLAGVLTATLGVGSLIYGISNVAVDGWLAPVTVGCSGAGLVLLVAFVLIERRSAEPMMPLRIVVDRIRGSAFLIILMVNAAAYAFYLLLTYYLQVVKDYSAFTTGLAFVPIGIGILLGSAAAGRAVSRWQPRRVVIMGLLVAVVGVAAMALLQVDTPFWALVLPVQVVAGVGFGATLTTIVSLALSGIGTNESGVASALTNAMGQVGGAAGVSVLNVIAVVVTAAQPHPDSDAALNSGYVAAFLAAAALLTAALLIATFGTRTRLR
ncbi:DHA2 family efflux MFS transporter permease subunit [Kibdelosporangium persicum]|uniref:MFS transporter n=1 Tax=Kibdelosporangium persicum TaxID=2698649 RepID=A0ABX2FEL3_9PSEU|nr:DHA2 family efflux MFS transporter permease subunit [Kibdelosporangium persicum]NRN69180.1 MFS transporter [Kibdelosporangium persicum]